MQENQPNEQLLRKERKELRYQQRLEEKQRFARNRAIKHVSKIVLTVLVVGGGIGAFIWYLASMPSVPEGEVISRNGLHWHPELTITVKGQKQEIPANIGIGLVHRPIHTHDSTGVLHMEMQGIVRRDDTKLGQFFKIWGKEFNSNCIFDNCKGAGGKVTILVNGKENNEFENYEMKDNDKIEVRYE